VGIGIGSLILIICIGTGVYWVRRRRNRNRLDKHETIDEKSEYQKPELDAIEAQREMPELEGVPFTELPGAQQELQELPGDMPPQPLLLQTAAQ